MNLESYIREKRRQKEVLLMTHIVLGYPSLDENLRVIEAMIDAGVDLMELQIPFSEPMADGPVILKANQNALDNGTTVEQCLQLTEQITSRFDIPFIFVSYCNILFQYGFQAFAEKAKSIGVQAAIIPDLPPEEGEEYINAMVSQELNPIYLFTPNTTDARMATLDDVGSGFMYCVSRKGVTGAATDFSSELKDYLRRCRAATNLPLALGFGIKDRSDIDSIKGLVDIAIVGSESIRVMDRDGVEGVSRFIHSLVD